MHKVSVPVQVLSEDWIPTYATPQASGADAKAAIPRAISIEPGSFAVIPTGLRLEIPEGFELQVRPRSGFAAKYGVTVLNAPGTIDGDYRGEICVILINHGKEPFEVLPKMRIAQLVFAPVVQAQFVQKSLSMSLRGEGGFGHTGVH